MSDPIRDLHRTLQAGADAHGGMMRGPGISKPISPESERRWVISGYIFIGSVFLFFVGLIVFLVIYNATS